MEPKRTTVPHIVADNIEELIVLHRERESSGPWYERFTNPVIAAFGSFWFLLANFMVFTAWIIFNVLSPHSFDRYPFEFLTLSVSLEAIFITIIVLIAQNKLQKDADERAELDLHINLLAESEISLILKKLTRIETQLNIHVVEEEISRVNDLIEDTSPSAIAHTLRKITKR